MPVQLELPFSTVTAFDVETRGNEDVSVVYAKAELPTTHTFPAGVRKHTTTSIELADTPVNGRPARLVLTLPRLRDPQSGATATFKPTIADPHHRITQRLSAEIRRRIALGDSFTRISEDIGVSPRVIGKIADRFFRELEILFDPKATAHIGIDECHLKGHKRAVIVDVQNDELIDILEYQNRDDLYRKLVFLKERDRVEAVVSDFHGPYFQAARAVFSGAAMVVDKYHIILQVDRAMHEQRKAVRRKRPKHRQSELEGDMRLMGQHYKDLSKEDALKLDGILKNNPTLEVAYWIKEDFHKIFNSEDLREAEVAYGKWRAKAVEEAPGVFQAPITLIDNWHAYVFSYFDVTPPITNARTEQMNNKLKNLYEDCRAFGTEGGKRWNFEKFRALALLRFGQRSFDRYIERYQTFVAEHGFTPFGEPLPTDPVDDLYRQLGYDEVSLRSL